MRFPCRWFPFALLLVAGALQAQEVTISSLVSVPAVSHPSDTAPKISQAQLPDYPPDWLQEGSPHYATIGLLVGDDGKVLMAEVNVEDSGTLERDLVHLVTTQWRFKPGRLKGRSVVSACRVTLLFNAAPASSGASDRPVRIISTVANPPPAAGADIRPSIPFDATLLVKADGTPSVTRLTPHPAPANRSSEGIAASSRPEIASAVTTMLGRWQFEPARKGGQPVDQSISLEVWAVDDRNLDLVRPAVIAKTQVHPEYPYSLRESGNRGQVLIDFIVNKHGIPEQPKVVSSSHPDFEQPAIAALLQWRFQPAAAGGVPIAVKMRVPIIFQLNVHTGGAEPYALESAGPQTGGQYPYDVPPQPLVMTHPVYPFEALRRDQSGSATAAWLIGTDGKVIKVVIAQASSPEFGQAYAAAIYNWEFEPARLHGKPTRSMLRQDTRFDLGERDFELDATGERLLRQVRKDPASIPSLGQLDRVPKARYQALPRFPPDATAGETVVEFYLDEKGQARFPHALRSTNDALIYPALSAVARWQFEPPMKNGRPTAAVAQIPISYSLPVAPAGTQ